MIVALASSLALASGAATPDGVLQGIQAAITENAPWKMVDFVLPEDLPTFVGSLDMLAGMAAWTNEDALTSLAAIRTQYGVVPGEPATDAATFARALKVEYAHVSDFPGLAKALWDFASAQGSPTGTPQMPRLKGGKHPRLVLGSQTMPLTRGPDGQWYVDLPDPALASG